LPVLDLLGNSDAVHAGHPDVGKDRVIFLSRDLAQRLGAVACRDHDVPPTGKHAVETLANHRVVIDDQNFA